MNFIYSLIVLLGLSSVSTAEEDYTNNFNLAPSEMPVLCGHPDYVHKFITNKGFKMETASLGRAGAKPDGEPVMMITTYENEEHNQSVATVDIPSGESTCIIYHTFDRTNLGD